MYFAALKKIIKANLGTGFKLHNAAKKVIGTKKQELH